MLPILGAIVAGSAGFFIGLPPAIMMFDDIPGELSVKDKAKFVMALSVPTIYGAMAGAGAGKLVQSAASFVIKRFT